MATVPYASSEKAPIAISIPLSRELILGLLISCMLLIPCFWHRHIEAGDLASHVYNAWLAELIEQGKAPGLYIVTQWNNVLFDVLLVNLAKVLGFGLAEKLATSLAVLVFFWGVFLLMKAVAARAPWFLTPVIAMLTYGRVFHLGFMNYYLSVGLCCAALSFAWTGRKNGLIAAVLIAPLILLAHPLGFVIFLGVAVYRLLWRSLQRWKWILPILGVGVCFPARWYLLHHPAWEVQWREVALYHMTGADQFHVFGPEYAYFSSAIEVLAVLTTVMAFVGSGDRLRLWKDLRFPVELYLVSLCAMALLPENIHTDPTAGWIGEIAIRLTLVIAIFGLCWLATLPERRWHLAAYGVVAVAFFVLIYRDTSFLNRMEANAEQVTHPLPFGTRVLATMHTPPDYRAHFMHIADRACIGHCFLFSNYEAATKQFRIRANEDNRIVTAAVDDSEDMQSGMYIVQPEDLPLKEIYQCDVRDLTLVCIRDLAAGEKNGRIGYRPSADDSSAP